MAVNSTTILSLQSHPGDSSAQSVEGDKYKGDGYYSRADGLHTVQISLSDFVGTIEIQGSLETNPGDTDWFNIKLGTEKTVDTTGKFVNSTVSEITHVAQETSATIYNFIGNFVWVRAMVSDWTEGNINSIKLNH